MAFFDKSPPQFLKIVDDTVVYNRNLLLAVCVWMSINPGWFPTGSPARMAYADISIQGMMYRSG
jgi:hypothetical protein